MIQIVADSISPQGHRITTMLVTMPRIILAEFNTHRMLSRNSASSRAIPFDKMVETVENNPFIPLKWMKQHKGMQGTDYFEDYQDSDFFLYHWREAAQNAIRTAKFMSSRKLTKQVCNRLLEPFMWHTVLVTATEWENFFALRLHSDAEIHMQHVAQLMLDAMNDSEPIRLQEGQWHIPFGGLIDTHTLAIAIGEDKDLGDAIIKIATARCAQTSYTVVGDDDKNMKYIKLIALHDRLLKSGHMSPFEHCAKAMTQDEYHQWNIQRGIEISREQNIHLLESTQLGWCGNFRGWIQYRKMINAENRSDNRLKKHHECNTSE